MVCQNQIALCKLHNCTACDHHGDEEHCPFAHNSAEDATPTIEQLLGIYASSGPMSRHKKSVVSYVRSDIALVGVRPTDKCTAMSRSKFKALISLLSAPMADGSVRCGVSIQSHLAAFRSITSDGLEDKCEERGFDLPSFSIPVFKAERRPVQEVSDRTIRKVEIAMEKWLASGTSSDRDAFKMCFFALYCGMRAGDICNAKWDIIRHTTAGVMIAYTPRKTRHSTGVTVSFTLDNRTYCKIEPLIGRSDEYIIARHADRAPAHVRRDGEYSGMHVYLRKKVNRMLAECGIGNDYRGQKKVHALRKYFETDRVFKFGRQQAAADCGHTLEVQRRSYLGTFFGKVA